MYVQANKSDNNRKQIKQRTLNATKAKMHHISDGLYMCSVREFYKSNYRSLF